jgi:hypothetical protein
LDQPAVLFSFLTHWKNYLLDKLFDFGNRKKSHVVKSGEYGGLGKRVLSLLSKTDKPKGDDDDNDATRSIFPISYFF